MDARDEEARQLEEGDRSLTNQGEIKITRAWPVSIERRLIPPPRWTV